MDDGTAIGIIIVGVVLGIVLGVVITQGVSRTKLFALNHNSDGKLSEVIER